jgi:hypothetical protein
MMSKRAMIIALAMLCVAATGSVWAANAFEPLVPSALSPQADGTVGAAEYSWQSAMGDMQLWLSVSADSSTLHVALRAPTSGWAAVGLGSLKMNGAFMVLGYDDKAKQAVSEQTGVLFGHKENKTNVLLKSAVLEKDGATTLEFSLPAAGYLSTGSLKMIMAYGKQDNFTSKHAKYTFAEVPFKK